MSSTSLVLWKIFIVTFICLADHVVQGSLFDHYPADPYNRKPCVRLKNTINVQAEICTPTGKGGFVPDTVKNCEEVLKGACPEFNKAECTKYYTASLGERPACRLWYLSGNTWMEVYYINYLPKSLTTVDFDPFDIVEVHRAMKRPQYFANATQADFPASVQDETGERGLTWIPLNITASLPQILNKYEPQNSLVCQRKDGNLAEDDERCSKYFADYLRLYYSEGVEPKDRNIPASSEEIKNNANITIELKSKCLWIVVPGYENKQTRAAACQVLYERKAKFDYYEREMIGHEKETRESNFVFLEVQFYQTPWTKEPKVQYAHWSEVETEKRDFLFANGD